MKMILGLSLLVVCALSTTSANTIRTDGFSSESRREPTSDLAARTWRGQYFTWLTDEQKDELDEIVVSIESQDENAMIKKFLAKALKYYNNVGKELATDAKGKMKMFCKSQMTTFFGPQEMGELTVLKESGASAQQLFAKFHEFTAELADKDDQAQVRLYAAFCKKIFKLG